MLDERLLVVGGPAVDPIGRGHVPEPRAPQRQRVDDRLTDDQLLGPEPSGVEDPVVRAGQVEVPRGRVRVEPAAIDLPNLASGVEDGKGQAAPEVLVPGCLDHAQVPQPATHSRPLGGARVRDPVTQRPITEPDPERLDRFRVVDPTASQERQRVAVPGQRLRVMPDHHPQQLGVASIRLDQRRELRRLRPCHRSRCCGPRPRLRQRRQRRGGLPQQLHRVPERDSLSGHHPVDRPTTTAARPQAVPQVLRRGHHQARGLVVVERTAADQVLALGTQLDPATLHQPLNADLGLDPRQFGVEDACHADLLKDF